MIRLFPSRLPLWMMALAMCFFFAPFAQDLRADSPTHQEPPDEDPEEDDCDEGNNGEEDCEKCEEEEPENSEECPTEGDPFSLRNGEFYLRKTFLSQSKTSDGLHFTPYYSAFSDSDGVLGYGWTFNLRMQLYESADGYLIVRKSNGKRYRYQLVAGVYKLKDLPNSETITISGTGAGLKYLLTTRGHDWYRFDAEGRLEALGSADGGEVRMSYDPVKQPVVAVPRTSNLKTPIVVVRDWRIDRAEAYRGGTATGVFLQFGYDADDGHLTWVRDQGGRQVDLQYNNLGQLELIDDPEDNGYAFTYYPGNGLMESFSSPGCSDCIKTTNHYNSDKQINKQTQGDAAQGTEMSVTYSTNYTEVTHTVKDSQGVIIPSRTRQERTTFKTDLNGRSRVLNKVEIGRAHV